MLAWMISLCPQRDSDLQRRADRQGDKHTEVYIYDWMQRGEGWLPRTASDQKDLSQLSEHESLKDLDYPNIVQYLRFE